MFLNFSVSPIFNCCKSLEDLVPNNFWGQKASTNLKKNLEVDFMHFQENGHTILAKKIYSEIIKFWKN